LLLLAYGTQRVYGLRADACGHTWLCDHGEQVHQQGDAYLNGGSNSNEMVVMIRFELVRLDSALESNDGDDDDGNYHD
jgi:hypothetical protein